MMVQMANLRKIEVTNLISGLWDPLRVLQNDMVGANQAIWDNRNSQNTRISGIKYLISVVTTEMGLCLISRAKIIPI